MARNRIRLLSRAVLGWQMMRSLAMQILDRAQILRQRVITNHNNALLRDAFEGWKISAAEIQHKSRISRMIVLFSTWRLYVKEQVLMRRYLNHLDTPGRSPAPGHHFPHSLFASAAKVQKSIDYFECRSVK